MRRSHDFPTEGMAGADTDVDRAHDALVLEHLAGEAGVRIQAHAQLRDVEAVPVPEGLQVFAENVGLHPTGHVDDVAVTHRADDGLLQDADAQVGHRSVGDERALGRPGHRHHVDLDVGNRGQLPRLRDVRQHVGDPPLDPEAEVGAARGGEPNRLALRERRPETATDVGLRLEVGLEERGAGHDRVGVGRHHAHARARLEGDPHRPRVGDRDAHGRKDHGRLGHGARDRPGRLLPVLVPHRNDADGHGGSGLAGGRADGIRVPQHRGVGHDHHDLARLDATVDVYEPPRSRRQVRPGRAPRSRRWRGPSLRAAVPSHGPSRRTRRTGHRR